MITRIPLRLKSARNACFSTQAQRWASYDKTELTKDALKKKVESGFDANNADANPLLDTERNTISTSAGDLPLSPLFQPDWMKARRRQRKDNASKPTGRFRKKLANNPYAQALATPIRRCPNTSASMPRYFLQDFELVKHPQDNSPWWAPGPLAFEKVTEENKAPQDENGSASVTTVEQQSQTTATPSPPRRRSPITSYALCRKSVIDAIGGPNRRYASLLLATRTGMATAPSIKNPVWRKDMGDVLLDMMRRHVVDALISRVKSRKQEADAFIQPCGGWDAAKNAKLRGCVLWLPKKEDASTQYATLDVEGAKYGQKLAVHNLNWLLGESEVRRLKDSCNVFRESEILVMEQLKSKSVMKLHLLLWRLQGYLAQPPSR